MLNQHFLMLISDLCEPVGPPLHIHTYTSVTVWTVRLTHIHTYTSVTVWTVRLTHIQNANANHLAATKWSRSPGRARMPVH